MLKDFLTIHLPYCIERIVDSDQRFIVLNREYKPIGHTNLVPYVNYELHAVTFKGLTPAVAQQISWEGKDDLSRIWLYADHNMPTASPQYMERYLKSLAILAHLKLPQSEIDEINSQRRQFPSGSFMAQTGLPVG